MLPRILRYILATVDPGNLHYAESVLFYLPYIALSTLLVLASLVSVIPCTIVYGRTRTRIYS